MAIDVGDEAQQKDRKKAYKLRGMEQQEFLQQVISTVGGRAVMWDILCKCEMFRPVPHDDGLAQRHGGKRDIGLTMMEELFTADMKAYNLMRDEAASRDARYKPKEGETDDG
jgi:hypothetical protein